MAVLNPRFEDAGVARGEAAHWTLASSVASEALAGFGPEPAGAVEDFERWTTLTLVFGSDGSGDVVLAFFTPLLVGYEAFEHGWANDAFLLHFPEGTSEACAFGQGPIEDFESGWGNALPLLAWDDSLAADALFDALPVEAFEQHWQGNEDGVFALDLVLLAPARFDLALVDVETFDGTWPLTTSI